MAAPLREHAEVFKDEVLVERLQDGDEAAFEELYERYFKRIAHFVRRRMDNQADVEETVQEVFINVFSSIQNYRGDAPFVAWVFGLTRRTIANRYKRKRHPTVSMEEEDTNIAVSHPATPHTLPTPDQVYDGEERARQLDAALVQKLSSEQQQLFKLHHMEERPIAEIAEMLGKSEDSVKSNLYRTRKLLLAN
ncbi:MAG: RNA polymerase sigma factor [Myxococcota bacterium]|nr:RNA polymerase sigma factor [Myxococcota bacterium]